MKKSFAAVAVTLLLVPASALAQSVPVSFRATVNANTNGADAAAFPVGSPITIAYVVNTGTPDLQADPQRGVFGSGTVNNLSVSFPTLGVFAQGTSGGAQTFDNFVDGTVSSDQVFLFGGSLSASSRVAGNPIVDVEIDYLSGFLPLPDEPLMISGDAVPAIVPPFAQGFVILSTSKGPTFVHFQVTGPGTLLRITANGSDGPLGIQAGSPLAIDMQFDAPGTGLAGATVSVGVVTPSSLVWLGPNGFTTTPTAVYTGPLNDFGPTSLFNFANTAGYPLGTYRFFILVRDNATGEVVADLVEVTIQ